MLEFGIIFYIEFHPHLKPRKLKGRILQIFSDGQRVLLETDWDDSWETPVETDERYFVFGNYIGKVLLMVDELDATPIDHYVGHDHLFSPVVLFSGAGAVIERYEYDACGKLTIYTLKG